MQNENSTTGKTLTVRDLAKAFNSQNHQEYRQMIDSAALPAKMRQFLLRKQYYIRFQEDCAKFRENRLATMQNSLAEQEAEVEASLEALEVSDKDLEKARKSLADAQHAFRLAKKRLDEQQTIYDEAFERHQKNQERFRRNSNKHEDQERLIKEAEKLLREAQNYVLIHSSATLSSISKKSGILVCTRYDANELHFHKHVDQIIDISEETYSDLIPVNVRELFNSEEEYNSAIAYVELVLKFFFDGGQYELLYNSEGISKLLNTIL